MIVPADVKTAYQTVRGEKKEDRTWQTFSNLLYQIAIVSSPSQSAHYFEKRKG